MKLLLFDQLSKRNPYWNLAIEEAICFFLANQNETELSGIIRFWQNPLTAVMGLSEKVHEVLYENFISKFQTEFKSLVKAKHPIKDQLYIARRASGGGTVLHNLSYNLNFSFFLSLKKHSELFPIKKSYEVISNFLITSLKKQNLNTSYLGQSDISLIGESVKKISGNSQFRKRNCLTHHGTLILSKDLIPLILKFQKHPPKEPDYRKQRSHQDFLTCLPNDFLISKFKEDLTLEFSKYLNVKIIQELNLSFTKEIMKLAVKLYKEKYSDINYILGAIT